MSTAAFVDRIDPFAKRSLKKKTRKSQGSSRYRNSQDVELQPLPPLKGEPLTSHPDHVNVNARTSVPGSL